jgi:hypothetical protein
MMFSGFWLFTANPAMLATIGSLVNDIGGLIGSIIHHDLITAEQLSL